MPEEFKPGFAGQRPQGGQRPFAEAEASPFVAEAAEEGYQPLAVPQDLRETVLPPKRLSGVKKFAAGLAASAVLVGGAGIAARFLPGGSSAPTTPTTPIEYHIDNYGPLQEFATPMIDKWLDYNKGSDAARSDIVTGILNTYNDPSLRDAYKETLKSDPNAARSFFYWQATQIAQVGDSDPNMAKLLIDNLAKVDPGALGQIFIDTEIASNGTYKTAKSIPQLFRERDQHALARHIEDMIVIINSQTNTGPSR